MRKLAVRVARALLPSWRFFDEIDPAPKLFYRTLEAGSPEGAWLPLLFRPARRWVELAFNPEGNLALARHALIEQLLGDVAEPEVSDMSAVESFTSYALVSQLVREQLRQTALRERPGTRAREVRFQFKITLAEAGEGHAPTEDVLISRIHEV